MEASEGQPAPESGDDQVPTYEELAADPEIAALLDFDPVPRRNQVEGGWSPDKQREVIARLAHHGSANKACTEMGMHRTGLTKLAHSRGAGSFQAAWDGAVDLARRRRPELAAVEAVQRGRKLPTIDHRRKHPPLPGPLPGLLPRGGEGEVLNEFGDYEDEASLDARAGEARDSISAKLLRCRRMYLSEISASPGKRAAFEILTGFEIDWDKAARLEPQFDEPYRDPNMREPDMLLTGENGWFGDFAHGPNKLAELRRAVDQHRAKEGKPAIAWGEEE